MISFKLIVGRWAANVDTRLNPVRYFGFEPSNSTVAQADAGWKCFLGHAQIDA